MRLFLFACLALLPAQAFATKLISRKVNAYYASFGVGSTQSVAFTTTNGSTGQILAPDGASTELVQIIVSAAAFVVQGTNQSATGTDMYVPANTPTILEILAGNKVSAVQVNGPGTLFVTHLKTWPNND